MYLFFTSFFQKNDIKNEGKFKRNSFVTGLMMNLLNPKVAIFFIAFFPGFLFDNSLSIPKTAQNGKRKKGLSLFNKSGRYHHFASTG